MPAPSSEHATMPVSTRETVDDLHLTFVDQSKDAKDAARLAAEAKLTDELQEGGIVRRVLNGVWKGNIAREYYTHKYARQAHVEIESSGNIYVHEADEAASRDAQFATIERFQSEYEEAIHTEAGERRSEIADSTDFTASIKNIIRRNVNGELSDEAMLEERTRLLNAWKDIHGAESAGEGKVRIDNLLDIAATVRGRITHENSVDDVLQGMKVSLGEARSGVRTEVRYNNVEQLVEKFQRTRVGSSMSAVVSPEIIMTAATVAASVLRIGTHKVVGAAMMTIAPGIASGIWAGARENMRVKEERTQHLREMAQGKHFEVGSKRREEMEQARYESVSANELIESLQAHFNELGEIKDNDELRSVIDTLAAVEVRIRESDAKNIDLISYSDAAKVEAERLALDIARAQAKIAAERALTPEARQLLGIDDAATLQDIIQDHATAYIETVETDVSAKDKAFRKLKARRVAIAAAKGVGYGLTAGLVAQELVATMDSSRDGLVEGLWNAHNTTIDGTQHQTLLNGMVYGEHGYETTATEQNVINHEASPNYATSSVGDRGEIHISSDYSTVKNENGTISIVGPDGKAIVDDLKIKDDGSFSKKSLATLREHGLRVEDLSKNVSKESTRTESVDLKDFLKNHKGDTTRVTRQFWYDNDTGGSDYDKNEQRLWWGGENGTGVKENGTYQMSISSMTQNGSYNDGNTVNWQEAAERGDIKLALSASKDSQGRVFLIDVNKNGNFNIPPDSPAAKLFSVENGQLHFNGAYAEVAHMVGKNDDGVEQIRPLATEVGENNLRNIDDEITVKSLVKYPEYKITGPSYTTVESNVTSGHVDTFTEMAPTIPIQSRRSLERLPRSRTLEAGGYYSYNVGRMSPEEIRRFERTLSPRIRKDPDADLKPKEEFDWYRQQAVEGSGAEYVKDLETVIEASPELRSLTSELKSIIMVPVKATGEAESAHIYDLLKTYAGQSSEALKKNLVLLHVNWFKSAESDTAQRANIQKTIAEIERAKADFPELKVATVESQWTEEQRQGGVIGHVARKMNDAALFALQKGMQEGRMADDHDVLLIRNDADPKGISKKYLENYIKSFESNEKTDVFTGTTRFDNRKAKDLPGFVLASNFMQSINLIETIKDKRVHTGGANFGIRASAFAAVGGSATRDEFTGAGSDDVMLGKRILAARSVDRRQSYNRQGLAGYFDKLKRTKHANDKYPVAYRSAINSDRKVGIRVFGAQIDTDSDRLEALYLQGEPIINTWDPKFGFDVSGHKDRNEDLSSPEMVALKERALNDSPDIILERLRHDIEGTISAGMSAGVIETALGFMFSGIKRGGDRGYILSKKDDTYRISFTDAGKVYLKNKLTRDANGRFDAYGSRLARQLYGQVNRGARRQRRGAPLSSVT